MGKSKSGEGFTKLDDGAVVLMLLNRYVFAKANGEFEW